MQTYIYYPRLYTIRRKAKEKTNMAYSKITRKMAGVIYGAIKRGEIRANEKFVKMLYKCADAYINHDSVWDDVEDSLKAAIDAIFNKDLALAQEKVDRAIGVHDCHWADQIGIEVA